MNCPHGISTADNCTTCFPEVAVPDDLDTIATLRQSLTEAQQREAALRAENSELHESNRTLSNQLNRRASGTDPVGLAWQAEIVKREAAEQRAATLETALRDLDDAIAGATDDHENCEDCAAVADSDLTDESACAIHRSQELWSALMGAWEALGPCLCGHPRSQHHDEDSSACRTCRECQSFRLPARTTLAQETTT
jgi:hypothetical protein